MTKITVTNNVWSRIEGQGADEVFQLLRFRPKGYNFAPSFKNGYWDGYIKLAKSYGDLTDFPTGLLSEVLDSVPELANFDRSLIDDGRVSPPISSQIYTPNTNLDKHQNDAVNAAIVAERGVLHMPTGVGKGRIIGEIARRLNVRTLVICDKKDVLHQLRKEIATVQGCAVANIGQIGDGVFIEGTNVTVATYQSLNLRLKPPKNLPVDRNVRTLLKGYECVIADESQHIEPYETILTTMHNAYYRFAMSATPFKSFRGKSEDRGTWLRLQAWTGPPIATMSISEGIDTGRIVPADVYLIHGPEIEPNYMPYGTMNYPCSVCGCLRINHDPKTGKAPGQPYSCTIPNYKTEHQWGIVSNGGRNITIRNIAQKLKGQTVILVSDIVHGELLADIIKCQFIHGKINSKSRQIVYDNFRNGRIKTLIIGKLGDEGLDLPNIDNLILAGGGNASHVQIQRVGRALRASIGKTHARVIDFEDFGQYISKHYKRRRRTYEQEPAFTVVDVDAKEFY